MRHYTLFQELMKLKLTLIKKKKRGKIPQNNPTWLKSWYNGIAAKVKFKSSEEPSVIGLTRDWSQIPCDNAFYKRKSNPTLIDNYSNRKHKNQRVRLMTF